MILDSLKNAALYYSVSPRLKQAFELISNIDLTALEAGRHELDGSDIFVNISEVELKKTENAKLEVHREYLDIQILLEGESEGFGWSDKADLSQAVGEFDSQKDVQFYNDAHQTIYTLRKGQFTILLPEDAHAPMIGEGKVKKAIIKVRL